MTAKFILYGSPISITLVLHYLLLSIGKFAGDSRSVLSVQGEVKPLNVDHKPENHGQTD
jgi:serine/threonine protein phosphatase PrpC